jgi:hypothetical protein
LPGAFCFDLRGVACQEREQSVACGMVEKSLGDAGARVMNNSKTMEDATCR